MRVISGIARGTKLDTLEGMSTRPTLDRVKESLFNIIQLKIENSNVLDLFAGSGSLGIESLSRGAAFATFCDESYKAAEIIKRNLKKVRFEDRSKLYISNFENALEKMKRENLSFDLVFLDPPYKTDYIKESLILLDKYDLLSKDAAIILETDEKDRIINQIENLEFDIYDVRKYGRVSLIFLKRKG